MPTTDPTCTAAITTADPMGTAVGSHWRQHMADEAAAAEYSQAVEECIYWRDRHDETRKELWRREEDIKQVRIPTAEAGGFPVKRSRSPVLWPSYGWPEP